MDGRMDGANRRGRREEKKKTTPVITAVQRGRLCAEDAPDARDRERAALVVEAIQQLRGRVQDGVVLIHELVPDDARRRARRPGGAGRRRRRRRRRGRRRGRHRDRTIDGAGGSVRSRWCLVGDALACRDGRIRGRTGAGRARQGGRGEGVDGGAARARVPRRRPRSIDRSTRGKGSAEGRTDGRFRAPRRRRRNGLALASTRRRRREGRVDAPRRTPKPFRGRSRGGTTRRDARGASSARVAAASSIRVEDTPRRANRTNIVPSRVARGARGASRDVRGAPWSVGASRANDCARCACRVTRVRCPRRACGAVYGRREGDGVWC